MQTKQPIAYARIKGDSNHPELSGSLYLFPMMEGTLVSIELQRVRDAEQKPAQGFWAIHIHDGSSCTGNEGDAFANAGTHYNPMNQEQPVQKSPVVKF